MKLSRFNLPSALISSGAGMGDGGPVVTIHELKSVKGRALGGSVTGMPLLAYAA